MFGKKSTQKNHLTFILPNEQCCTPNSNAKTLFNKSNLLYVYVMEYIKYSWRRVSVGRIKLELMHA